MKLKFTDLFKNECSNKFGIRPSHIENLIAQPDKSQNVILEGGQELKFYVKNISSVQLPYLLLAYGRMLNTELNIDMAFKIYPDFHSDLDSMMPVQILYELANRFGLDIQVGNLRSKFTSRLTKDGILVRNSS